MDGHEKPEQQRHRTKFISEYLTKIEPRCHRWIQLSNKEFDTVKEQLGQSKLLNKGYQYKCCGVEMIEFHVDDHEYLQHYADKRYLDFGGMVSVRVPPVERPIIVFGQDEAIYSQNASNTSHWVGPNGERPLLPKNYGIGKMISAFQCRETGWGVHLNNEQLLRVNVRCKGTQYFDTKAAADVGSRDKVHSLVLHLIAHLSLVGQIAIGYVSMQ